MSDETTLLPCPWCGCEAETHETIDGWIAACSSEQSELDGFTHTAQAYGATEAEAIAAWNTRAPVECEGWFYLPKPKNSLVQYSTPQIEKTENGYKAKQPVEVIESAIRAWGDELGEHIMKRICEVWNTRATHGTLTAEQVRETVEKYWHDLSAEYDMPEATALPEYSYDWQAIADELNTMLGNGTCEWVLEHSGTLYDKWRCSKCGYLFVESRTDQGIKEDFEPNFCPNCGRRVV